MQEYTYFLLLRNWKTLLPGSVHDPKAQKVAHKAGNIQTFSLGHQPISPA